MSLAKSSSWTFSLSQSLTDLLILFISFSVSFNVRHVINLIPSGNSFGIETSANFYPESNYLLILSIVGVTAFIFWLLKLSLKKSKFIFRSLVIAILSLSVFVGVIAPGVAKYAHNIDTFHNGEELSPALALDQGKKPYTEIFTLRGAGEDVVTPWLSFKLFGENIGSYFLLTVLLQLITAIIFYVLLSKIFRKDLHFLSVSLWFTVSSYSTFYTVRDIFVWVSLLMLFYVIMKPRVNKIYYATLGLLASLAIFYSLDRGLFLTGLLALLSGVLLVFEKNGDEYRFAIQTMKSRLKLILPLIFGYLSGLLIMLLSLGVTGMKSFISNTIDISKYQGYIFNYPYSTFGTATLLDWLPVLVIIVCGLSVIYHIRSGRKTYSSNFIYALLLLLFGVIAFRAATGRPDSGHIAYGAPVVFIALFYIVINQLGNWGRLHEGSKIENIVKHLPLYLVFFIALLPPSVSYYRLALMNQASLQSVKIALTAPSKPDQFWYTENVIQITDNIKSNTKATDYFFDFSSDPIFYYSTKLKNPTRFYISWFADPRLLEDEMLKDLKTNPPKAVLYESGTYYDRPDFISMKTRLPKVNQWILENYKTAMPVKDTGAILLYP